MLKFNGNPASRMLSIRALSLPWNRLPRGFSKCTASMEADLARAAMARPTAAAAFLSLRFGRDSRISRSIVLADARICSRGIEGREGVRIASRVSRTRTEDEAEKGTGGAARTCPSVLRVTCA